jgi:hypothetical protein
LALPWRKKNQGHPAAIIAGRGWFSVPHIPLESARVACLWPEYRSGPFYTGKIFSVCLSTSQDGWLSNEIFLEAAIRTPAPSFLNLLGYIAIFFIYHMFQFRRSLRTLLFFLIDLNVLNVTLPATPVAEPAAY